MPVTYVTSEDSWASHGRDRVTNASILSQTGMPSMFAIQRRQCWLGHVCRMEDGRIPKDIRYGELASGTRPSGRPTPRYAVTRKRDLKACGINPADLEGVTSDRTVGDQGSRVASFPQRKGERASGRKKNPEAPEDSVWPRRTTVADLA